jgi:hypothetical protein
VVTPVFAEVFGKNGRFYVAFWWRDRGGLRGRRGVLAVTFWGSKNAPCFPDLFSEVPVLGMVLVMVFHILETFVKRVITGKPFGTVWRGRLLSSVRLFLCSGSGNLAGC